MNRALTGLVVMAAAVLVSASPAVADAAPAIPAPWAVQAVPPPDGFGGNFQGGVSCPAAGECVAVRSGTVNTVERWDGTSWAAQSVPTPPHEHHGQSLGVSCDTPANCVAVGFYYNASNAATAIIEQWNGAAWTFPAAPVPVNATSSRLDAVSCQSPANCMAAGTYTTDTGMTQFTPFAAHWNGTSWTFETMPGSASSLSCPTASECLAVGGVGAFAERWRDGVWQAMSAPPPPAGASSLYELNGVSCHNARTCVAVGSYFGASGILQPAAEAWNGHVWTVSTPPAPATTLEARLTAVSCATTTSCTAVGYSGYKPNLNHTLAVALTAASWRIQRTVQPLQDEGFLSVSCVTAVSCVAMGWQGKPDNMLVEAH